MMIIWFMWGEFPIQYILNYTFYYFNFDIFKNFNNWPLSFEVTTVGMIGKNVYINNTHNYELTVTNKQHMI